MSGKPQYDESAVLNAAIGVFWRHGYANASISDLTEATGLSRSSLYQRFGDKDGLFIESLELYKDRVFTRMKLIPAQTSIARVEALLREFLPNEGGVKRPSGCLISRSNAEQEDLTVAGRVTANAAACQQRQIILEILTEGQSQGEIEPHVDVDVLAWYYFGVLQAIVSLPSIGATRHTLEHFVDMAMSAWPEKNTSV
ncbi:Transcriptional regulator, TetR protein [Pseudomonas syringae pv. philadelphi]|uniref:Transcriptional regulator, TetR protein n=1 Tax=Pseudomonas syringae pv. philadelphi TaxID=251706 RepID=A0A3M3YLK3_9PSED|nr:MULTISPECIES: TetR/AcrR family transcriptional regulator [Pseudomonas syringae group]RMO83427.1 Transcriptional regulator, TetR protein [Pseudomonas syringae pv. philadelphi]SDW06663.1 transcriptional regulator, TetR family [Pseudomonas syringae]SFL39800.1 transcriptional regulator, TetR family [Pseudomonas syringae]